MFGILLLFVISQVHRMNGQSVFPEEVAEKVPEQQFGEGKCPLTHYVPFTL
jgi:hypothetical protein